MRYGAIAAAITLLVSTTAALAEGPSEQPHDGSMTATYHGGFTGPISGESGGGFDLSAASPLWGGGHVAATGEEPGAFNAAEAMRIGVTPDRETAVAGRIDDTVR
ncbi:hypothetical protein [Elioraea sp.]|jgi:hypothetical protein|uniref:hypothetical protein n=1 Tax=Elioraea sp. TaxID=2185103 RepID=UPI003F6FF5C6